ncbi:hypothetical protein [Tropicimonas sp. IMCC34011]|uniref:hypothetical protein n=1 Tax=Tropicimonas sp. IMCC34011 TaxID=2248759 RepID=UPI000E262656|nr:hypothetical protein [Tropicimonas sp. IMCC34011]
MTRHVYNLTHVVLIAGLVAGACVVAVTNGAWQRRGPVQGPEALAPLPADSTVTAPEQAPR